MPLGLLGKKVGMSQMFDEDGVLSPVTLIEAGPCPVMQIKTAETDKYYAIQIGFDEKPERKANRPESGHAAKAGVAPMRLIKEFRLQEPVSDMQVGDALDVSIFEVGEKVDVIGKSIGRGFAGTIKRHHTRRGPESHGSMYHRRPGSAGMSATPSHTFKGKKLPGQLGNKRSTIQNLQILMVDKDKNLLAIKGSVPGHKNGYVMIRKK